MPDAILFCVDNSDWARNGDYTPNRLDAVKEAVREITNKKAASNPEHHFGVLAMAGKTPQLIVTLNGQSNSTIAGMRTLHFGGQVSLSRALLVGQLALKHREDKNKRQRLIVFIGSPLSDELGDDVDSLGKLGRRLKKSSIAIDLISFGEYEENAKRLESLMSHLQSNADNDEHASHLLTIPAANLTSLVDALKGSSMFPSQTGQMGDEGLGDELDMDTDPDLALAIRLSMEEERQRQQRSSANIPTNAETPQQSTEQQSMISTEDDEEQRLLQEALAMSLQTSTTNTSTGSRMNELDMTGVDTNDPDIQAALKSLEESKKDNKK